MRVRDTSDLEGPRRKSEGSGLGNSAKAPWHLGWTSKVEQDFNRERKMGKYFADSLNSICKVRSEMFKHGPLYHTSWVGQGQNHAFESRP